MSRVTCLKFFIFAFQIVSTGSLGKLENLFGWPAVNLLNVVKIYREYAALSSRKL